MCLAVVGKVVSLDENLQAVVDVEGNQVDVTVVMVPDVKVGDFVMVHAGFAISVISEQDHDEHNRLLNEVRDKAQELIDDK